MNTSIQRTLNEIRKRGRQIKIKGRSNARYVKISFKKYLFKVRLDKI